jgi:hypothetical protein
MPQEDWNGGARDNVRGGYGNEEIVNLGYSSELRAAGAFCEYGG